MGLVVWLITLVAAAIGYILANWVISIGIIGLNEIVLAVAWFLISFATYFAGKRLENETWFKLVSINFIITWAFCTVGVLLGAIVWSLIRVGTVSISLEAMTTLFFASLPLTLGPTATVSLGLRDV